MHTGSGHHTFRWVEGWAKLPGGETARAGWAHHGLAVDRDGNLYVAEWLIGVRTVKLVRE